MSPWHHERHARPVPAVHNVHGPMISFMKLRAVEQFLVVMEGSRSGLNVGGW